MDNDENLNNLKEKVRTFSEERDWDQFHNAKDLAIGMVTEASELLQKFRFKSNAEVDEMFKDLRKRNELSEEMADVLFFILRLSQRYDIDLSTELTSKLKKNEEKYPVDTSKGSNKKYTEKIL